MLRSAFRHGVRLLREHATALVEAFQDLAPEPALEETLGKFEGTAEKLRTRLGSIVASSHVATKRRAELQARLTVRTAAIEAAIQDGRLDLAQAEIAGQLEDEAEQRSLEQELRAAHVLEMELEHMLAALLAARANVQRELVERDAGGEQKGLRDVDRLSPARREAQIRRRLRELQARRGG